MYILVMFVFIYFLFPVYWLVVTAFKSDPTGIPPKFIPVSPTLRNFVEGFVNYGVLKGLKNSTIVALGSTIVVLIVGALAAYSLARFNFKGRESLGFFILGMRAFPPVMLIIPYFLIMKNLHAIDKYQTLIMVHALFNLPFAVWMLKGFFQEIPKEIEESAMVDGCSRLQSLIKIVIPIAIPGIIATAVISFIFSWNEFLFAFILTRDVVKTMPIILSSFIVHRGILWGEMSAGGVMGILPVLIFGFLIQKYIASTMTFGAVKE